MSDAENALDLLSTSQTIKQTVRKHAGPEAAAEIEFQYEQRAALAQAKCSNNAPYIFYVDQTKRAHVAQGCCNSWECPRCGQIRACAEYGRVVVGAKAIAEQGQSLYFLTLTCRGADLPLEDAQANYLKWTNTFLTNCRKNCKQQGVPYYAAQVTERQKRLHPHSHIITTFCPDDVVEYGEGALLDYHTDQGVITTAARHEGLYSAWAVKNAQSAGLGPMCDLSYVRSPVGVAVYAAKYFFKDAMTTTWPKGWRRVRYSQNWPKLPQYKSPLAFPLVKIADWHRMEALGMTVYADSQQTLEAAYSRLIGCVTYKEPQVTMLTV